MNLQIKDRFYDTLCNNPSRDSFLQFLHENVGEMDDIDFKGEWIHKGHLAKTMLAIANKRGGLIIIGVEERNDGTMDISGIDAFEDKAQINNEVAKYIPETLDYEILNFQYDQHAHPDVANKKYQMVVINDTPERLPFISRNETTDIEKNVIYVRRGTKCEKANGTEIQNMIEAKLTTINKMKNTLTLSEHLAQLKILYNELPQKIRVLVRKGDTHNNLSSLSTTLGKLVMMLNENPDEYKEIDNPNYPEETYEAFILRVIKMKKLKIENFLDIK